MAPVWRQCKIASLQIHVTHGAIEMVSLGGQHNTIAQAGIDARLRA